ncbi:FtsW/RodA/SpoVE family cell cycle protein [Paenibacillus sepulcri]|uniref:FtsW/RodA/SpoVE family cell cycle protein n=1 Tax=Paenibacillus sepulcri TaxID=359917 RepID=A0ABS7C607_9BACL|nr:FtsW/RodA/SpoVE family cell cycle protein [Paenibacillus sepulcri]
MRSIESYPQVQKFLQAVCQQVKAVELHEEIKEELIVHIADRAEELFLQGQEEGQAVEQAIQAMGSAASIGDKLHHIHRPKLDWGLICLLALIAGMGIIAICAVQAVDNSYMNDGRYVEKKLVFTGLGSIGLAALWFFDYRRLNRFSLVLFPVTLTVLAAGIAAGRPINGMPYLNFYGKSIDVVTICTFMLVISLAGMKLPKYWTVRETFLRSIYLLGIPTVMYMKGNSLSAGILYLGAAFGFFWLYRRSVYQFLIIIGAYVIAAVSIGMLNQMYSRYFLARLTSFLSDDKFGAGYMTYQSLQAIHAAGWWGHGFAASNTHLPYQHSNMVFSYLIYSFGWAGGLIIAAVAVLFIVKIAELAISIRDEYGRRLVGLLLIVIGIEFVLPMLMAMGLAPNVEVLLPFLSYGNTLLLLHFGAVGLILTVYKRKNMISSRQVWYRQ